MCVYITKIYSNNEFLFKIEFNPFMKFLSKVIFPSFFEVAIA